MKKILFALLMLLSVAGVKAQSFDFDFLNPNAAKRWEANIELGLNYTFPKKQWDQNAEKSGDVLVGAGYNFSENWYLGVESGVLVKVGKNIEWIESNEPTAPGTQAWKDANLIPVMGDIRYAITTHKTWQPFIELRMGYAFLLHKNEGSQDYIVCNPRAGVKFRVAKDADLRIGLGYMGLWGKQTNSYKNLDGITLQVGLGIKL